MDKSKSASVLNLPIDGSYERARLDKVRADREQLELDLARKNLVVRDDVHKAAFESARKLRDSLSHFANRPHQILSISMIPQR